LVKYKKKLYVTTRMGFRLSSDSKKMSWILATVFGLDRKVAKGTNHYIVG